MTLVTYEILEVHLYDLKHNILNCKLPLAWNLNGPINPMPSSQTKAKAIHRNKHEKISQPHKSHHYTLVALLMILFMNPPVLIPGVALHTASYLTCISDLFMLILPMLIVIKHLPKVAVTLLAMSLGLIVKTA